MNVVESRLPALLGFRLRESDGGSDGGRGRFFRLRGEATIRLEHADPSEDGTAFDPVDDACRRPPVAGRSAADSSAR